MPKRGRPEWKVDEKNLEDVWQYLIKMYWSSASHRLSSAGLKNVADVQATVSNYLSDKEVSNMRAAIRMKHQRAKKWRTPDKHLEVSAHAHALVKSRNDEDNDKIDEGKKLTLSDTVAMYFDAINELSQHARDQLLKTGNYIPD